jgi:hypothetical protein
MTCQHKRIRSTTIFLEPTEPAQLRHAVVTFQCHQCGTPFEISAIPLVPSIALSADLRELRVAITEARKGMVQ